MEYLTELSISIIGAVVSVLIIDAMKKSKQKISTSPGWIKDTARFAVIIAFLIFNTVNATLFYKTNLIVFGLHVGMAVFLFICLIWLFTMFRKQTEILNELCTNLLKNTEQDTTNQIAQKTP